MTDGSFGPRNAKNYTFPTSIIRNLCKADIWFFPSGVRIKEVWLYVTYEWIK